MTVRDLMDNASEPVFGVALDLSGTRVASHGQQSYFSTVADPFHLRLCLGNRERNDKNYGQQRSDAALHGKPPEYARDG